MTTIAYHHESKTIAVDSRTSSGCLINTDKAQKIQKKDGVTFVLAGSNCDISEFIDRYSSGTIDIDLDCSGFIIENSNVYHVMIKDKKLKKSPLEYNDAEGSGYAFAISAMDFGKSAMEAVEYAKTRDNRTGGEVKIVEAK